MGIQYETPSKPSACSTCTHQGDTSWNDPPCVHFNWLRVFVCRGTVVLGGETLAEAQLANEDTFRYTNAAPQAAKFNQGLDLWLGIESYLQGHAARYRRRIVVFTGPIFSPLDPVYRGTDISLRFFKVAAFIHDSGLAATGYVYRLRSWAGFPGSRSPASPRSRGAWSVPDLPSAHPGSRPGLQPGIAALAVSPD